MATSRVYSDDNSTETAMGKLVPPKEFPCACPTSEAGDNQLHSGASTCAILCDIYCRLNNISTTIKQL